MKFTLSTLGLVLGIFSVAASAQVDPQKYPFRLRAWRDQRWVSTPPVNYYVELDESGNAIVNKTAGYPGFDSYLDPTPMEGRLYKNATATTGQQIGYLFPLFDVTTTPPTKSPHYQLKYGVGIPKIAGVLYTNFTTVGRGCGGMCGGSTLDYDLGGDRGMGEWYIIPKSKVDGKVAACDKNVWYLRYIGIKSLGDPVAYPEGALSVFLWKF